MKKTFFLGGTIFLIAGIALQPTIKPLKAETSLAAKPVTDQPAQTPPESKKPRIELLNSGTGNKEKLRLQPPINFQQNATMSMKMEMTMLIGGQALPSFKQPEIVTTLTTKVTKIDPNGDIHYESSYSDVNFVGESNLPPQALNALRTQMQKLIGLKIFAIVDNQGNVKKTDVVIPKDLDPSLKEMMQQMSSSLDQIASPLPAEAVGIGSQWRVTSSVDAGGMNLQQTATYQLVDLKNGVATLKVKIEQSAPSQNIKAPELPPGVTLTLKSYQGNGEGQAIVALNKIMPISSSMSLISNTEMVQKNVGRTDELNINQKLSLTMLIESK